MGVVHMNIKQKLSSQECTVRVTLSYSCLLTIVGVQEEDYVIVACNCKCTCPQPTERVLF
jgi:hypothetical protein